MNSPTPNASAAPARPALAVRVLKAFVALGLGLALTIISGLATLGFLMEKRDVFEMASDAGHLVVRVGVMLLLLFFIFLPFGLGFVAFYKRWLTWTKLAAGWLAVLPVSIWLTWDEPALRHPPSIAELTPSVPDAERSYRLLMRYAPHHPTDEAREFDRQRMTALWKAEAFIGDPAKWLDFVRANRAGIESDWAKLSPQRRWLNALNGFERIGDLTPVTDPSDAPQFSVWRTLARGTAAIATLRAIDGHGEEAVDLLVPALATSRKLQEDSRSHARSVIGFTVERTCLQATLIVLDQATVSTASRRRLTAALGAGNAGTVARRMILAEYAQFLPTALSTNSDTAPTRASAARSAIETMVGFLSPLLFNPIATANRFGDHLFELAALAESRDLVAFALCHQRFTKSLTQEGGMKNLGGRFHLIGSDPAVDKTIEAYWKTVDLRDAVRRRLMG